MKVGHGCCFQCRTDLPVDTGGTATAAAGLDVERAAIVLIIRATRRDTVVKIRKDAVDESRAGGPSSEQPRERPRFH